MFRKSSPTTQPNLFSNFTQNMESGRQKKFNDPNSWHNLFREFITSKVDESLFSCLFSEDMGRPNSPVRMLIGMMILKEGFGWSDERLFEATEFDMLVMNALGMNNMSDEAPCGATYYNFKKNLYEHQIQTGEDLIGNMFRVLTKCQAKLFGVHGKFTRMDSKLIGSNICKSSRLQLIISVLQVFYKDIKDNSSLLSRIKTSDNELLSSFLKQKSGQIIYSLDNQQREELLASLGYLLLDLQAVFSEQDSNKYHLIVRVLSEQYSIEGNKVVLRDVKQINSSSLQSPHDEDASYRKKGDQKLSGFSVNVTETCNDDTLNLITDVKVEKSNYSDNAFLQDSIQRSETVVGYIENVNADGAYHSADNQKYAERNDKRLIIGNIQGRKGKYEFEINSESGNLTVINTKSGEIHEATEYKKDKYKINENGKHKYFSLAAIKSYFQRKEKYNFSKEELNRRNNVEATIFQLSFFTRKNKTRYRGKFKNQLWAYNRSLWINLIKIRNWLGEVCPIGDENAKTIEPNVENFGFFGKKSGFALKKLFFGIENVILEKKLTNYSFSVMNEKKFVFLKN